jgi:hypothetical protein
LYCLPPVLITAYIVDSKSNFNCKPQRNTHPAQKSAQL